MPCSHTHSTTLPRRYTFSAMLRVYKHFEFSLSHPAVRLRRMAFSSYPGARAVGGDTGAEGYSAFPLVFSCCQRLDPHPTRRRDRGPISALSSLCLPHPCRRRTEQRRRLLPAGHGAGRDADHEQDRGRHALRPRHVSGSVSGLGSEPTRRSGMVMSGGDREGTRMEALRRFGPCCPVVLRASCTTAASPLHIRTRHTPPRRVPPGAGRDDLAA